MTIKESIQNFKLFLEHYKATLTEKYTKRNVLGSPSDKMTIEEYYTNVYEVECNIYKVEPNY